MKAQSLVQRTLGSIQAMDTIAAMLPGEQFASRRAVGRRVCEEFGFRDRLGRLQVTTGLKALRALAERSERIVPPTPAAVVSSGGKPSLLAAGGSLAENRPESTPREIEVVHPCYQPSCAKTCGSGLRSTTSSGQPRLWSGPSGCATSAAPSAARPRRVGHSLMTSPSRNGRTHRSSFDGRPHHVANVRPNAPKLTILALSSLRGPRPVRCSGVHGNWAIDITWALAKHRVPPRLGS